MSYPVSRRKAFLSDVFIMVAMGAKLVASNFAVATPAYPHNASCA
jgi:hypothetical protein